MLSTKCYPQLFSSAADEDGLVARSHEITTPDGKLVDSIAGKSDMCRDKQDGENSHGIWTFSPT